MREVYHIVMVPRCLATVGVATIACTKEGSKDAIRCIGGNSLASTHIAKFRTTAEEINLSASYCGAEVAGDGFGCIDATSIEFPDVSILHLPSDISGVVRSFSFTDTLHSSSCNNTEAATVDIAFSIVGITVDIGSIEASEVEFVVITSSD